MLRHLNFMKSNKSAAAVAVFFLYVMLVNLNIYKMALISKEHRTLAKDLGGGDCSIEPLADIEEAPGNATKTLLASYPGSGKRFTFSVIAGLTNHKVADDWDFSGLLDYSPLTVKTSWPHRAGIWSWENDMDQVILLIRNPRWAIPSYHTLRYEIDYANNWYSTFTRLDYVYTRRPNILVWEGWRDENFAEEIKNWSDYIDFWMQGGKYSDSPIQHPRCIVNKIDCKPKLVIDFDNFYKEHPGASFFKLGQTLDHLENIEGITALARTCVLDKVFTDKSLHNGNRDGMGPPPTAYRFTAAQHAVIETTMTALKNKYSQAPYDTDPVAQDLVFALNNYISENVGEKYLEEMMEMFYS